MNVKKAYQLDVSKIKTLNDVKVILDKLSLTTYQESPDWAVLSKYFTTEIEIPEMPLAPAAPQEAAGG